MSRLACVEAVIYVALLLSLLCAPTLAETDRAHLSQDPRVEQAREQLNGGHHRRALDILRPLADPARSDITDIRFLIGLAAMGAAKEAGDSQGEAALLREAIAALHAILVNQPQLTRVRLELARAFFLNGDDDLSKTHFERVAAGNPPAAMLANIQRFLFAIQARRRWSNFFSINLESNDNINSGTETEVIYLFGLPFQLNSDSRPRSETGIAFAMGGEYQHPLGADWRWRFGADATHGEYQGSGSDQTTVSLRSGPRWLSRTSDASAQAVVSQRWSSGSRHSTEHGVRLTARHQLSQQLGISGRAQWRISQLQRATAADEVNTEYALNSTYLFSPLLQGSAGIGLTRSRPRPQSPDSGSRGHSFNLGLGMILPQGWTAGGNLQWSRERHRNFVPGMAERQLDRKRTGRLFVLHRGLTFFGFSPQFIITREGQKSNFGLHTYQRTRLDLRLVRQS